MIHQSKAINIKYSGNVNCLVNLALVSIVLIGGNLVVRHAKGEILDVRESAKVDEIKL